MTDHPWNSEPDSLDFEAEGLPCAMRRNGYGVWCGYVGVCADHPLFGLPVNHLLKLPPAWFDSRKGLEGTGPIDVFLHVMRSDGQPINEACPISIALQVHGGVNFAEDSVEGGPDGRWWFGFDCGHAGDLAPTMRRDLDRMAKAVAMPDEMRESIRRMMAGAVYRDRQYVVSECQSLAAQLVAIAAVINAGIGFGHDSEQHRDGH